MKIKAHDYTGPAEKIWNLFYWEMEAVLADNSSYFSSPHLIRFHTSRLFYPEARSSLFHQLVNDLQFFVDN